MSVIVKYFSRKMLQTVDVNALMDVLMSEHGDAASVLFVAMDSTERSQASERDDLTGIDRVHERFWILDDAGGGRQHDLEAKAVRLGTK